MKIAEVGHKIGTMSTMAVSQSYAGRPSRFVSSNRKVGSDYNLRFWS
jgi:hypothetical protein